MIDLMLWLLLISPSSMLRLLFESSVYIIIFESSVYYVRSAWPAKRDEGASNSDVLYCDMP